MAQLSELGIAPFELLISNLYPFRDTVASGASPDECVEQIDIGGPAMVRAAAKNHASVAVITSPEQYPTLREALGSGGFTLAERQALAATAFAHTASYDVAVASWMGQELTDSERRHRLPGLGRRDLDRAAVLRYGENPHQRAALYGTDAASSPAVWPAHGNSTARRCRTTTTSTRTPRGGPRTTSTRRRWRSSSTPTRAGSRSGRTSPRRTGGRTPAIRCRPSAG